ncbi:hypothetical protein STEG23_016013 [Scotinomys teguina]
MIQREADVKSKVTAVALTDSVHNVWHQEAGKTIREWMRENCCNWVSSSEPLDTSVESMLPDCPRVSAAPSNFCDDTKLELVTTVDLLWLLENEQDWEHRLFHVLVTDDS